MSPCRYPAAAPTSCRTTTARAAHAVARPGEVRRRPRAFGTPIVAAPLCARAGAAVRLCARNECERRLSHLPGWAASIVRGLTGSATRTHAAGAMNKDKVLKLAKGFRGRAKNCFRVSHASAARARRRTHKPSDCRLPWSCHARGALAGSFREGSWGGTSADSGENFGHSRSSRYVMQS